MTRETDNDVDFLNNRPRRGEGVRRLNRVPLLIAGLMLLLILGAVTYTYQMRLAEMRHKARRERNPAGARQYRDAL
jgi:type IV secretion system protein VirB10